MLVAYYGGALLLMLQQDVQWRPSRGNRHSVCQHCQHVRVSTLSPKPIGSKCGAKVSGSMAVSDQTSLMRATSAVMSVSLALSQSLTEQLVAEIVRSLASLSSLPDHSNATLVCLSTVLTTPRQLSDNEAGRIIWRAAWCA